MGKNVKWIEHKGKKILFIDQKDLIEEDILTSLEEAMQEISNYNNEIIPILIDVTNTFASEKTKQKGKELEIITRDKGIKSISAIVGISGIKKIIASAIQKKLHFSNTIEEAKEWLVNQI